MLQVATDEYLARTRPGREEPPWRRTRRAGAGIPGKDLKDDKDGKDTKDIKDDSARPSGG